MLLYRLGLRPPRLNLLSSRTITHRVFLSSRPNLRQHVKSRTPALLAATIAGASLASYLALEASRRIAADAPPSQGGKNSVQLDEIFALRSRKSVERCITGQSKFTDIDEVLRRYEESHFPDPKLRSGIARYDICQIPR